MFILSYIGESTWSNLFSSKKYFMDLILIEGRLKKQCINYQNVILNKNDVYFNHTYGRLGKKRVKYLNTVSNVLCVNTSNFNFLETRFCCVFSTE